MDKKMIYAVVVVVILLVAAVGIYMVFSDEQDEPVEMAEAELKVYGNINGDRFLDEDDAKLIQSLIDDGYTATDYPLADANRDGVLDDDDVSLVTKAANGEKVTIWHVNYHDTDGDGTMDEEIVSTTIPVTSAIATLSVNTAMVLFCLGITDQIKGATYTTSTFADSVIFDDTFLNTDKTERIGTSSTTIDFEDGQIGSSETIATKNVTAVISDWNRTYLTNESTFEESGIDVIRVACGSVDSVALTHTAMLLGLIFGCSERANSYVDASLEVMDYVNDAISGATKPKFIASSMDGYISSGDSDYTEVGLLAGGEFGLPNVDFGGSTSIKIVDHPEVYSYSFDYIIHLRSNLNYTTTQEKIDSIWADYTDAFEDWEYAYTGQYLLSGFIPVVFRIAYAAEVLHADLVDADKIDQMHQDFVDTFFNGQKYDVSSLKFVVSYKDIS